MGVKRDRYLKIEPEVIAGNTEIFSKMRKKRRFLWELEDSHLKVNMKKKKLPLESLQKHLIHKMLPNQLIQSIQVEIREIGSIRCK
jgi:hypothetical protein